jgi:hypothetical protein
MSNQWQPIETAPKDGTEILAYEKYDYRISNGEIIPFERIKIVQWDEVMQWGFNEEINPSHWMPLPKPPKN